MIDLKEMDRWINICEVDGNEIKFTKEYLDITKCLGWGARKLASHLVLGWNKEYEGLLDYFGPEDSEEDWYSGIDGETMDVCEIIPNKLYENNIPSYHLDAEWHRDVYRAQLATIRLPKKLLQQYVDSIKKGQEK